jgi:hypothetical protein
LPLAQPGATQLDDEFVGQLKTTPARLRLHRHPVQPASSPQRARARRRAPAGRARQTSVYDRVRLQLVRDADPSAVEIQVGAPLQSKYLPLAQPKGQLSQPPGAIADLE